MADFDAYRKEDDEAILEAFRTLSRDDFQRRAASIARDRGVPAEEVETRARFLHNQCKKSQENAKSNGVTISSPPQQMRSPPKTRSSPHSRRKSDNASFASSSSSSELTANEEEFAWLMEEYFYLHPNAKKKLAFWFVELHASSELTDIINEKKDSMTESQWKKAGKLNIFVKKSRMDLFNAYREKARQQLRDGYRRDVMREPFEQFAALEEGGDASSASAGLAVSFSHDEDEFDETGVFPPHPIDIKPRHKRGDKVFAAWIDNLVEDGELSWFPGTVRGYDVTEKRGHYGEGRTYHVEFDDGDVDYELKDIYVMSRKDYYLTEKGIALGRCGVTKVSGVGDEYAETVGWYKTDFTSDEVFGLLSDAVKARDEKVVDNKAQYVTEADLLYPQDWDFPEDFATRKPKYTGRGPIVFDDEGEVGGADTGTAAESPRRSSPRRKQSFQTYDAKTDDDRSPRRTTSGQKRKVVLDRTRSTKRSAGDTSNGGENGKKHKRQKQKKPENANSGLSASGTASNPSEADSLRFDLAIAHRLCAKFGLGMLSQSHLSARYGSGCLICEMPTVWSSINPENISVNPTEIDTIHHGIYSSRQDVKAVIHLKSPAATAVSCLEDGFQFLSYDSAPFHKKLVVCEYRGDAKTVGTEISTAVKSNDSCNTILLRNNGFVCFGPSIRDAWFSANRFEECCKLQLEVMKSGGKVRLLSDDDFKQAAESGISQCSTPACSWDDLSESVGLQMSL